KHYWCWFKSNGIAKMKNRRQKPCVKDVLHYQLKKDWMQTSHASLNDGGLMLFAIPTGQKFQKASSIWSIKFIPNTSLHEAIKNGPRRTKTNCNIFIYYLKVSLPVPKKFPSILCKAILINKSNPIPTMTLSSGGK